MVKVGIQQASNPDDQPLFPRSAHPSHGGFSKNCGEDVSLIVVWWQCKKYGEDGRSYWSHEEWAMRCKWKALCTVGATLWWFTMAAGAADDGVRAASLDSNLQTQEVVQELVVKISVAAEGDDLAEPVALDLGLGFPLWLHPVGRQEGEAVPFGAVPEQTNAAAKVAAGSSAVFAFSLSPPAGQDTLRTSPQLLAGVRVSDISRIGFASQRSCDWVLEGYQIEINGKPFASDTTGTPKPDPAQATIATRLTEVELRLVTLSKQYDDLRALVESKKATAADLGRLKQIDEEGTTLLKEKDLLVAQVKVNRKSAKATREADLRNLNKLDRNLLLRQSRTATENPGNDTTEDAATELNALLAQKQLLEGRLQGKHPWFVDWQFRPTRRGQTAVKTARVVLETHSHSGADTQDRVFFSTGGHKYLLNPRYVPLSAADGPQQFEVDLLTGPLCVADLRGWAVGILASGDPQGQVPDRWHPQRILVQLDDAVVYDSDESQLDRSSLQAVRLIAPAHLDENGTPVVNSPSAREVFLWEAGRGLGLDLVAGGALELPDQNDPNYPAPEDGLADGSDSSGTEGNQDDDYFPPDYPPLPGENGPGPGASPGGSAGGSWPGGSAGGGKWPSGGGPGGGPGSGSKGGFGGGFKGGGSKGGPGSNPTSAGKPFQMQDVWFSKGWKIDEPFQIDWKVTGDLSGIDHFLVTMRVVRPDQPQTYFAQVIKPVKVSKSQRSYLATVDKTIVIKRPYFYLAPCVTAVTKASSKKKPQNHSMIGAARAVFPATTNAATQPVPKDYSFTDASAKKGTGPIAPGGPPKNASQRGVWFPGKVETPTAIKFGRAFPATHIAAHPRYKDTLTVRYEAANFTGKQLLFAHLGFMGNTSTSDVVDAKLECILRPPAGSSGKPFAYSPMLLKSIGTSAPLAMPQRVIDTADLFGASGKKATLEVKVTFSNGGSTDPKCPPGVFGLRLVPFSSGNAPPSHPVHADLAIDKASSWLAPGAARFSPVKKTPQLVITNKGPHDIPATTLSKIRVKVNYYMGQYGNKHHEISVAAYKKDILCTPKPLTDTKKGKWTGPLKAGQSVVIVPTGHTDLNTNGVLTSSRPWKVLKTWAGIQLPNGKLLHDPNLSNNGWKNDPTPPVVVGSGPLDFEVLAFQGFSYAGVRERYELNPEKQRQRLIWDLSLEAGKKNMYRKIKSLKVGKEVDLYTCDDHHFFTEGIYWYRRHVEGKSGGASLPWGLFPSGSMMICPKRNYGPIGVKVRCDAGTFKGKRRNMFFPLPEDMSVTHVDIPKLIGSFDDKIDTVSLWQYPTNAAGNTEPRGWLKAVLHEDSSFGGRRATLGYRQNTPGSSPSPITSFHALDKLMWDKTIGSGNIANEVSSLKIQGVGQTSFPP